MDTLPTETLEYLLAWIVELDDYHRVRRVCTLWKTLMLQILKRKIRRSASSMRMDVLAFHSGVPVTELDYKGSSTLEPKEGAFFLIVSEMKMLDLHRLLFKTEPQEMGICTGSLRREYTEAGKALAGYRDMIFEGTFSKAIYRYLGYACVIDTLKKGIETLKVFNPAYLPENFRLPIAH